MGKPLVGKRKRGHIVRREKAREPTLVERRKRILLIRAARAGTHGIELLRDLKRVKDGEDAVLFSRKNDDLRPFEDETRLEFLCNKNDCGMFAMASHSKKRPNNLVLGRIFDQQLLDMVELGVSDYISIHEMLKRSKATKSLGGQSAVVFHGDEFDKDTNMQTLRSMLLDLFRPAQHEQADLTALDHLVVCTAAEGVVYVRNYVVAFKAREEEGQTSAPATRTAAVQIDGVKMPELALVDMGPSIDLTVRRARLPAPNLMKMALKQPKNVGQPKKVKNISHDELQGTLGRIHMERQDMSKLVTRSRFKKTLKRAKVEK